MEMVMKKVMVWLMLLIFPVSMVGCGKSNYEQNMQTRKEMKYYEEFGRARVMDTVSTIVTKVIHPAFSEAAKNQIYDQFKLQYAPSNDTQYALAAVANIALAQAFSSMQVQLEQAKANVMEYMVPIVESIMKKHEEQFGTPATWEDVAKDLVGNIPFLATVGGMYFLGAKAIENAGTHIVGQFTDSEVQTGPGQMTVEKPSTVTTDSPTASGEGSSATVTKENAPE
jgi:hypothetical protein